MTDRVGIEEKKNGDRKRKGNQNMLNILQNSKGKENDGDNDK